MLRCAIVAAILFASTGTSRADSLPLVGVPAGYFPGQTFSFDVTAPGLSGVKGYSLEFTVSAGTNPPDLTVGVTLPSSGYPFPDTSNFSVVPPNGTLNSFDITVSDSASNDGSVSTAVNSHLATISISPGVNLSGPITVTFTEINFDFTSDRDTPYNTPETIMIPQSIEPPPASVPAPPALILMGIGGLCMAGRHFFTRPKAAAKLA